MRKMIFFILGCLAVWEFFNVLKEASYESGSCVETGVCRQGEVFPSCSQQRMSCIVSKETCTGIWREDEETCYFYMVSKK